MNKILRSFLVLSSTFFFSLSTFAQSSPLKATAKETYDAACEKAKTLLDQWASDAECIIGLASSYNTLSKTYTTYGPEAVDQTDDAAMKTATSKLNSASNTFTSKAESTKNTSVKVTKTTFDPNFHIYLCFGQSNMEGNATPELVDYSGSSKRFLTMAAVNMSSPSRTKGQWYVARPPLCRQGNGLTPADWFGKTLAKNLPDSITVGVINVALGGCSIKMFMEDQLDTYLPTCESWLKSYASNYGNNPYRWLINCAKQAQKVGVIKGILLHQGCSDNMQQDWPTKVNTIYTRMLKDLGLERSECPLLIGELLRGGACEGHNNVIATCPSKIENSHVVSSKDCPGASDRLHFTAEGYRIIGKNYAEVMYGLLARYFKNTTFSVKTLKAKTSAINTPSACSVPLYINLTDAAGKTHDVTASCTYTFSEEGIASVSGVNLLTGTKEGTVTVTATYTNDEGATASVDFTVTTGLFLLKKDAFNPAILGSGTASFTTTSGTRIKSAKGGLAGWRYTQGLDLSGYQYLVLNLKSKTAAKPTLRIYGENNPESTHFHGVDITDETQIIVNLKEMADADGKAIDPSKIYIVGLSPQNTNAITLDEVFVTNDDPTALDLIPAATVPASWYDLMGRKVERPSQGIFIKDGKKILIR